MPAGLSVRFETTRGSDVGRRRERLPEADASVEEDDRHAPVERVVGGEGVDEVGDGAPRQELGIARLHAARVVQDEHDVDRLRSEAGPRAEQEEGDHEQQAAREAAGSVRAQFGFGVHVWLAMGRRSSGRHYTGSPGTNGWGACAPMRPRPRASQQGWGRGASAPLGWVAGRQRRGPRRALFLQLFRPSAHSRLLALGRLLERSGHAQDVGRRPAAAPPNRLVGAMRRRSGSPRGGSATQDRE